MKWVSDSTFDPRCASPLYIADGHKVPLPAPLPCTICLAPFSFVGCNHGNIPLPTDRPKFKTPLLYESVLAAVTTALPGTHESVLLFTRDDAIDLNYIIFTGREDLWMASGTLPMDPTFAAAHLFYGAPGFTVVVRLTPTGCGRVSIGTQFHGATINWDGLHNDTQSTSDRVIVWEGCDGVGLVPPLCPTFFNMWW